VAQQGVWKVRTNQELGESYKELDIRVLAGIKKKRLEWVGHVVRMGQRTEKMLESIPD
jgi:hypothetical protein